MLTFGLSPEVGHCCKDLDIILFLALVYIGNIKLLVIKLD